MRAVSELVIVTDSGTYKPTKREIVYARVSADKIQKRMWRRHRDELVGTPEVDPWSNAIVNWYWPQRRPS